MSDKKEVLGADGKPQLKIPVVRTPHDGDYPMRSIDLQAVKDQKINPLEAFIGLNSQVVDHKNIILVALLQVARDVYARQPEGPTYFLEFCQNLGINMRDLNGKETNFEQDLKSILESAQKE